MARPPIAAQKAHTQPRFALQFATMALELVFLGTGTSAGVPMIGCDCAVCHSADPRDRRDRPGALVRYDAPQPRPDSPPLRQFLIDTTPDLRHQAIRLGLNRIDGVFYTHNHADHVMGIDDLRRFNAVMKQPIDIYAEQQVIDTLRQMFVYIFDAHNNVNDSFVAQLIAHPIMPGETLTFFDTQWTPLRLMHGRLPIVGFRIDHQNQCMAYCTDVSTIPPQTYPLLADLDVLVLDALRYRHHPTHLTVEQALDVVEHLKPRQTYFTHISHDIRHAELEASLPDHIKPAYDGLVVKLDGRH